MLSRIPALSRLAPSRSDVSELRCPPTFDTPQILITAFISVRMIDVRRTSILQDLAEVTLPEALRWIREVLARGGPHPDLAASRGAGRQSSSLFGRRSSRVAAEKPGMEGGTFGPPKTNALSMEAGITPTAGLSSSWGKGEPQARVSAELKPGSHGFLKQPSSSWLQARLRKDVLHGLHKSAPSIRIYAVQLGGMYYEVAALHGVILTMLQHGRGEEEEEKERHSVKRSARALGEGFVGRSGRPSEAAGGDEEQGPPRHDASGTGRSALSTLTYRTGSQSGAASRSSRGGGPGRRQVSYAGFDVDLARSAGSMASRKGSTLPERSQASAAAFKHKHEGEVLVLQQRALGGLQISRSMLAKGSDAQLLRRASMALQSSMRWTLLSDEGFRQFESEVQALMVANGMHLMLAEGIQIRWGRQKWHLWY